jgi:hypothetical protein
VEFLAALDYPGVVRVDLEPLVDGAVGSLHTEFSDA